MVLNTVPQIQALCLTIVCIIKCLYVCMYRVGQKTGLFFRLDNFVTVSTRKACSMSSGLTLWENDSCFTVC